MNNLHEFYDFEPGDEVYHYEYEIMCFGIIRKIEGNYAIVEDDFALRSALVASLEVSGYKIISSESAESAITQLAKTPLPDMVITDIQMSELNFMVNKVLLWYT